MQDKFQRDKYQAQEKESLLAVSLELFTVLFYSYEFSAYAWYEQNHAGKIIFPHMDFSAIFPQPGMKQLNDNTVSFLYSKLLGN